jgi:mono/diheme cytochrome c family protein
MTRSVGWLVLTVGVLVASPEALLAQTVMSPSQDPLAGSRVFGSKGCIKCHSVNGVGGKVAPDLARTMRPRSFVDLATAMWNHLPQMTERMKQLGIVRPQLDSKEAGDLVGFLYTLNYFDAPGNAEVGKRLFSEKHCIVCHIVRGAGGVVGPNLDHLQQFGSPIFVASAMWNHGPQMAEKMKERRIARPTFTGKELRDLIAYLAPATGGPEEGPLYVLAGRAGSGQQLFAEKRCIACHAIGGVGGRVGPDLIERGLRQSPIEFAATIWNKAPAMAAAMQSRGISLPQLTPEQMADIVAYLYSVRYFAGGSVQQGYGVATQKGCLNCHASRSERGRPAGDLMKAEGLDSPPAVLAALWNHALVTPPVAGKKVDWPVFSTQEMADLIAMLQFVSQPQRAR